MSTQSIPALSLDLRPLRLAQRRWQRVDMRSRRRIFKRVRAQIATRSRYLQESVELDVRNSDAETLAAEIIPLADACRFLEREAARILSPSRPSRSNRPAWLSRVDLEIRREPYGVILIVGAANYPIFLVGVQLLQAVAAGNAVLIKPGRDGTRAACALTKLLQDSGVDRDLIRVLPEEPAAVLGAIVAGVDKVVLTGSATAGRAVLSQLADRLIPATMELSGCDALFVLPTADLDRVAQAVAFGLRFNGSATCLAPRRVFVPKELQADLARRIVERVRAICVDSKAPVCDVQTRSLIDEAISFGATEIAQPPEADRYTGPFVLVDARPDMTLLRSDLFAPVVAMVPYASIQEAFEGYAQCPFALGASIFGDCKMAKGLAQEINAGCVVVNDVIAPTADPRVPFGGRRQSGFGVTRGAEGLLEMTQVKAVLRRRGRWLPHLEPPTPNDGLLLDGYLQLMHGQGLGHRWRAIRSIFRAAIGQRRSHSNLVRSPQHVE